MFWYFAQHAQTLKDLQHMAKLLETGQLAPNVSKEQDDIIMEYYKNTRILEAEEGKHLYFPNEKERKFHLQPHTVSFISGGNRSGKSTTCIVDVVAQAEGWHPRQRPNLEKLYKEAVDQWVREQCEYLLDNKLWISLPPIKARCVGMDFPNFIDKVLGPEYARWATQADLKNIAYDNEKQRKITWKNKSHVEFMTYAQEVIAHGGAAIDVYHLDEEPTEGHYQQALMRIISTKGRILCGMTAEKGVSWTEQKIFEPAEKGDPHIYAMEMSTYDNPIATPQMIDTIKKLCLNQAEIDIRIHGKRVAKGGNIFEQWKEAHPFVIDRFDIPQEGGMLIMAIDPHPQLPHAVSWIWVDIERQTADKIPVFRDMPNMFICAELFEKGGGYKLASYIQIVENKLGRTHDIAICDPRGWQKSQEDKNAKSVVEQLAEAGIFPIPGSKNLMGGLVKMKECLDIEFEVTANMMGDVEIIKREYPQLIMFSDLPHHLFEFKNYRWQPPPMTRSGESKEVAQKPVDKDDHFIENDRRIIEWVRDQNFEIFDTPEYEVERLRFVASGKKAEINFEEEESVLIGA